ncbi:MAG: glycoside hydrolase family 25 protein [Oscillospiraceae bacterium]|nr:glycoside hydrolase family 25 protein [Oscillospiraceae bacterium]
MKKIILSMIGIIILLSILIPAANADGLPKENSFRYENGVLIESDITPQTGISLFSADDGGLRGIDVSEFQGDIDWEKVKSAGIDFAVIRCGFGSNKEKYDDAKWKRNADECTRLGIPFGAYLYSYAESTDGAKSEAAHALRLLEGYKLSLPVYLDLEDDTVAGCSNEVIGQMADTFCTALQNAGYEVGIYANLNWWNNRLTSGVFDNPTWHKWVAQWSSECTYNGDYTMWQYTSIGSVDGISGNVDMDIWYDEPFTDDDVVNSAEVTNIQSYTENDRKIVTADVDSDNVICYLASYLDNRLIECDTKQPINGKVKLSVDNSADTVKLMVWNKIMKPLIPVREVY